MSRKFTKKISEEELAEIVYDIAVKNNIPPSILHQGDENPEITGYVFPDKDIFRVPIKDSEIVGFFTPRKDGEEWRVGAIFVTPEHRGKGLAGKALRQFFTGDKLPSYANVGIDNYSSQKAFESAGFTPCKDVMVAEDGWQFRRWTKLLVDIGAIMGYGRATRRSRQWPRQD